MTNSKQITANDIIDYTFCKRKVALKKVGQNGNARPSTYLLQLARSEREFRRRVFEKIQNTHKVLYVKSSKNLDDWHKRTLSALSQDNDFIVNACLISGKNVAKFDAIMKLSPSSDLEKNRYIACLVSETNDITRSKMIELYWNTKVLSEFVNVSGFNAIYINDYRRIQQIDLQQAAEVFESTLNSAVAFIENEIVAAENFPPDFCSNCSNCSFRYSCVPLINEALPLSLLTISTKTRNEYLKTKGITNINDIATLSKAQLMELNFDNSDIRLIEEQVASIRDGKLVFKERIKVGYLLDATPVTLGLVRKEGKIIPKYLVYYRLSKKLEYINFEYNPNDKTLSMSAENLKDLESLFNSKLIVFGSDYDWIKTLLRNGNFYADKITNLTDFLKENLQTPI